MYFVFPQEQCLKNELTVMYIISGLHFIPVFFASIVLQVRVSLDTR